MINLKAIIDEFDVGKLKSVPADLKKTRDVVDNEAVKNSKFRKFYAMQGSSI